MNEKLVYVRPRPGTITRRPPSEGGGALPAEGAHVPLTTYWLRRLYAGELLTDPIAAPEAAPKARKGKPQE